MSRHLRGAAGFTLVEAIMVIVITGVLAALVTNFVKPLQGYFDAAKRADMGDEADVALRRMSRELHAALPNSVRVSGNYLEFLPTVAGGRYRAVQGCMPAPCTPAGDVLDFTSADTSFDVIGALDVAPAAGEEVVVYNLGISGADAYEGSNSAVLTTAPSPGCGLSANKICFAAGKQFPFESPANRFQIVGGPVTFACAGNTLWRYSGYARQSAQPVDLATAPLATATGKARLAAHVDCGSSAFVYTSGVTQRVGLVSMRLTVADSGQSITLYHQVHVPNVP